MPGFDTIKGRNYIGGMRIRPVTLLLLAFGLIFIAVSPLQAADSESYYIGSRSGADVHAYPRNSAENLGHLERMTDITVLEKRRGWWKVETIDIEPKVTGWVYESTVNQRYQPEKESSSGSSSFFSGFSSLFRSSEPQQKTAVLGVRGLEEEGGATTKANAQARKAVKWMDSLVIKNRDVASFIKEGDLNP